MIRSLALREAEIFAMTDAMATGACMCGSTLVCESTRSPDET